MSFRLYVPLVILLLVCISQPARANKRYNSSFKHFDVPAVNLVDQNGQTVSLPEFLKSKEPYAMSYMFTTCTTICPIMSATLAHLRRELGKDAGDLNLVSVSIDPEYDSPRRLREYAKRYRAGDEWTFFTGKIENIHTVQRTFTGFVSDKMDHWPVYILKAPGTEQWLVIDGLVSGRTLAEEYRLMMETAKE